MGSINALTQKRLQRPFKPGVMAGMPLGALYSKTTQKYPFTSSATLYNWANKKANARDSRNVMETLSISPDLKVAYHASRSMPSKGNLEREF